MKKIAFIYCENSKHFILNHPERPDRIIYAKNELSKTYPNIPIIDMKNYSEDEVLKFLSTTHDDIHLNKLKYKFHFNSAFSIGKDSYYSVLDLTRCIMTMCEKIINGDIDYAMLVVRPPGHHCCNHYPAGFCLINTAVVSANNLLKKFNKINILDIDLHHGGGTQKLVIDNKDISYSSIHNKNVWSDGLYQCGINGIIRDGRIINVALKGQSDDADYKYASDAILTKLKPFSDTIILSAGFDAHKEERNWVGDDISHLMDVSSDYYGYLGYELAKNFKTIFFILEGGYNEKAIAESIDFFIKGLYGKKYDINGIPSRSTIRNIQKNF